MPEQNQLPYRPLTLEELEGGAKSAPKALPYLLAVKFNYDVKQGGFSQLLYNLQGNFLAETEDMLIAAKAAVSHDYYVRAVTLCLKNAEAYARFISSSYADANDLKNSLQALSVEYLRKKIDFAAEAAAYLASCPKP